MKASNVISALVGGAAIYVTMAACSSSSPDLFFAVTGAEGADGGSLLDALADPVQDAQAEPAPSDGTRIKVRYVTGSDGSKTPMGIYDSKLNTSCSWRTARDGKLRCLPDGGVMSFFNDANCSEPLFEAEFDACKPDYASTIEQVSCSNRYRVYSVGDQVKPTTVYSWQTIGGGYSCTPIQTSSTPTANFYLTTEVPAVNFVDGELD